MKMYPRLIVIASGLLASSAWSHHSYAMFEIEKDAALAGTVAEWQWTNPHTLLLLDVPTEKGKPAKQYTIEGSGPAVLRERGWSRNIIKAGDQVTVHIHPLKDGSAGGQLMSVTAPDGKTYTMDLPKP